MKKVKYRDDVVVHAAWYHVEKPHEFEKWCLCGRVQRKEVLEWYDGDGKVNCMKCIRKLKYLGTYEGQMKLF